MKNKRILAVSLLCILLTSTILVGALALSRVSRAYNYATQFAGMKVGGTEGTNLSLTLYSDLEPARPVFDLFQYVTVENIEWRGATMDPEGNAINVDVKLASVEFEKLNEDNYAGEAEGLDFHLAIGDLIDILVRADEVDVSMTFWTCMDLPALNATGVLTGDVEVSLFIAVLPLPGLAQALYEYKGDRFVISLCILKPIELTIVNPGDEDRVNGDVDIQALVKTAPGISVEHVDWWAEGKEDWNKGCRSEGPMDFNETSGLLEGVWPSYAGGNGWYDLAVRAEGVQEGVEGFRYGAEDGISVDVGNPFEVHAYLETLPDTFDEIFGLMMEWWYHEERETVETPFDVPRRIGSYLMAPGEWEWDGGPIRFERWVIRDGEEIMFEHWDTKLEVNQEILGMLWGRQLECIYKPA